MLDCTRVASIPWREWEETLSPYPLENCNQPLERVVSPGTVDLPGVIVCQHLAGNMGQRPGYKPPRVENGIRERQSELWLFQSYPAKAGLLESFRICIPGGAGFHEQSFGLLPVDGG